MKPRRSPVARSLRVDGQYRPRTIPSIKARTKAERKASKAKLKKDTLRGEW